MSKDDKKKDETKPEAKPAGFTPAPAAGESKPPRQTTAPLCPNCSTPEAPQHTRAASSPRIGSAFFTYYRCPRCPYSIKIQRPNIATQVARARDAETDHSAR